MVVGEGLKHTVCEIELDCKYDVYLRNNGKKNKMLHTEPAWQRHDIVHIAGIDSEFRSYIWLDIKGTPWKSSWLFYTRRIAQRAYWIIVWLLLRASVVIKRNIELDDKPDLLKYCIERNKYWKVLDM